MKKHLIILIFILPAIVIFSVVAYHYNFIQDDAYISYRYVANFLKGDGLVYNIGERVEGITNFGWTVYLVLWGAIGADYIFISRLTGFIFGTGIIVLSFFLGSWFFSGRNKWYAFLPAYLLGINLSLAYWSPAGLETAAFAFLFLWSIYLYLRQNRLLILSLVLGVFIRPEGALTAGLLLIVEAVLERRFPRFTFGCTLAALAMSLPMVIFKLFYYGSILPNSFYAKTGFDWQQLISGLEYAGRFLQHYPFYALGLLIPLIFIKKMSQDIRAIWLVTVLYILYVVLVGGDVLKVHRFFIPLLGLLAVLSVYSVAWVLRKIPFKTQYLLGGAITLVFMLLSCQLPRAFIKLYHEKEMGLTGSMAHLARSIKKSDDRDFSVALSTIGIFGYELVGHRIIDMVGLTDSVIAKHPQKPFEGLETTWKERKYNAEYVLKQRPEYIVFSTGTKPSAPAERALLLYRPFIDAYRITGWLYQPAPSIPVVVTSAAYKKVHAMTGEIIPTLSVEYVQTYKQGLDFYAAGDCPKTIEYLSRTQELAPDVFNPNLMYHIAFCYSKMNKKEQCLRLLNYILEQDSLVYLAHKDLYLYEKVYGDTLKAAVHRDWLMKLVPWSVPSFDAFVKMQMEQNRK
ncbi:MAG: hypothetical protein JXA92_08665 [candidate division Zixibacteria bacterium]|nr:hypothetical protein [candidate division Zixibacteria bacterium]